MSAPRPTSTASQFVLRRGVPVPLMVTAAVCLAVGVGLIAWSPQGVPLVVGIVVIALGLAADTLGLVRMLSDAQRITLDATGIRLGSPRPADIGWDEVTAVRATGRILHIELRDRTSMVVDGEIYRRGFEEFSSALVAGLEQSQRLR